MFGIRTAKLRVFAHGSCWWSRWSTVAMNTSWVRGVKKNATLSHRRLSFRIGKASITISSLSIFVRGVIVSTCQTNVTTLTPLCTPAITNNPVLLCVPNSHNGMVECAAHTKYRVVRTSIRKDSTSIRCPIGRDGDSNRSKSESTFKIIHRILNIFDVSIACHRLGIFVTWLVMCLIRKT